VLVEITSFTLMALFVARLGTTATAAHQIAANVTALLYMTPLSLAIATSARVGYWRGAGDEARARKVALLGSAVALALAVLVSAAVLSPGPASRPSTAHAGVALLATRLLAWVALLRGRRHADGVHLRAALLSASRWRPLCLCVLLWGFGLGGGCAGLPRPGAVAGTASRPPRSGRPPPAPCWTALGVRPCCGA
jgi:MATE family multidrug resistance protein